MNINGPEFLVIALLAVILVGPERLPEYVSGLRSVVLRVRAFLQESQSTLKVELGEDIDWNQLDPRAYDPRRIVREALFDGDDTFPSQDGRASSGSSAARAGAPAGSGQKRRSAQARRDAAASASAASASVPFDDEAT